MPTFEFDNENSQEARVAKRFAIIALGGELATEYGITQWSAGDATKAAITCFNHWQAGCKKGNIEANQILESVRDFIDSYSDSKFSEINSHNEFKSQERAGWYRNNGEHREYLFLPVGFNHAISGHDKKRAIFELKNAGWLKPSTDKSQQQVKIGGKNRCLYVVTPHELED